MIAALFYGKSYDWMLSPWPRYVVITFLSAVCCYRAELLPA